MKFEVYYTAPKGLLATAVAGGQTGWRWRLRASNGDIIADGSEGYVNKADCLHGIGLVMDTNRQTPIVETVS